MSDPVATARLLAEQAGAALAALAESGGDDELVALLNVCEETVWRLDRVAVVAVAALQRRGCSRSAATPRRPGRSVICWGGSGSRPAGGWSRPSRWWRGWGWTAGCCRRGCRPPRRCSRRGWRGCGTSR